LESFTQPPRQAAGNPQQTHARAERHTPQAEERSRNSASSRTDSSSGAALVPGQPEVEPERGLILAKTGRALLAAPAGVTRVVCVTDQASAEEKSDAHREKPVQDLRWWAALQHR
jgi:hypothetical protein